MLWVPAAQSRMWSSCQADGGIGNCGGLAGRPEHAREGHRCTWWQQVRPLGNQRPLPDLHCHATKMP